MKRNTLVWLLFFVGWLAGGLVVFQWRKRATPGAFDFDQQALERQFDLEPGSRR